MTQRILYSKLSIIELEVEYVTDAARNGWGDQYYAYINRSGKQFVAFVGAQYAIATSSCIGAMHMRLAVLGIDAGDEVIPVDTNWIATASPTTHMGVTPVFVDTLPNTWCFDLTLVEAAITPRMKAIAATHLHGNLCGVDHLPDIGRRHGIPTIEDVAEAVGSRWYRHITGSQGVFDTSLSHGTKTMAADEGGVFVTNNHVLCDRVVTLNNHGRMPGGKQFWSDFIDSKYRISNMQTAIGCAQLEHVDTLVARRREIFAGCQAHPGGVTGLVLNPKASGTLNSYRTPTVVFNETLGITRGGLLAAFSCRGIDTRVLFYPLSQTGLFGDASGNTPDSCAVVERAINLPSCHDALNADIGTASQMVLDLV